MLLALAAFGVAGIATGSAFLASYAAENGLPFDLPTLALPRFALPSFAAPTPPGPTWCEATRRWRDPVTRAFVKAPC
ncbi:hypothetical protein [Methylobacterium sp. WL116]|uniref:hypothetical protein n=1 Tax=Methylobacterium sp. WL116 TaxID=2603889 RepID=UPI0011C81B96|nr:hypothetical protein [Methylobacterium sp. WL116]TXM94098.1 hypothetical protein FV223_06000 [Methylobacterium sp. WL116]